MPTYKFGRLTDKAEVAALRQVHFAMYQSEADQIFQIEGAVPAYLVLHEDDADLMIGVGKKSARWDSGYGEVMLIRRNSDTHRHYERMARHGGLEA